MAPKKYLNMYVTRNIINQYNTPHQCTSSTLSINNKISIKISTPSIVLSLLFYCYYSIVKPLWLLDSYLKNYIYRFVAILFQFSASKKYPF